MLPVVPRENVMNNCMIYIEADKGTLSISVWSLHAIYIWGPFY